MIPPFKPSRNADLRTQLQALENWASQLHLSIDRASSAAASQVLQQNITETEAGGGSSGSGSGGSVDAESIQGEPVDDTAPADGDLLTYDTATGEWIPRQWIDGSLGVGTGAAPAARLHLPAGQASANRAPQKFTAGTFLTAPEAGAVEYDSFRWAATTVAAIRKFFGVSSAHVTSSTTVANSVTPTTLFTGAIPANSLSTGQTCVARVLGRYSTANATDTVALAVKVGSVTVFTVTTTAAAVTSAPVVLEFVFTVRTVGVGGTGWGFVEAETNAVNKSLSGTATFALDTMAAADVTVVATWSAADAGNTCSIDQGWLSQLG